MGFADKLQQANSQQPQQQPPPTNPEHGESLGYHHHHHHHHPPGSHTWQPSSNNYDSSNQHQNPMAWSGISVPAPPPAHDYQNSQRVSYQYNGGQAPPSAPYQQSGAAPDFYSQQPQSNNWDPSYRPPTESHGQSNQPGMWDQQQVPGSNGQHQYPLSAAPYDPNSQVRSHAPPVQAASPGTPQGSSDSSGWYNQRYYTPQDGRRPDHHLLKADTTFGTIGGMNLDRPQHEKQHEDVRYELE